MDKTVITIGSSTLSWSQFIGRLEAADVGCIVDVRSFPRSRFVHFNQPQLRTCLNLRGISYVFLGDILGGHVADQDASYARRTRSPAFLEGIARILDIAGRCRPALVCAESDPLQCHRFITIARFLAQRDDVEIIHILKDGRAAPHAAVEDQLLQRVGLTNDLFDDRNCRLSAAYSARMARMGLRP